jgi:hypothetical protein
VLVRCGYVTHATDKVLAGTSASSLTLGGHQVETPTSTHPAPREAAVDVEVAQARDLRTPLPIPYRPESTR